MTKQAPANESDSVEVVGNGLAALLGIAGLVGAFFAWRSGLQITLVISLGVAGALLPALAYLSAYRQSRAAWAFLIALAIVLGIMTFFGAPKVRNLVGIPLAAALVLPLAFGAIAICLSGLGDRKK